MPGKTERPGAEKRKQNNNGVLFAPSRIKSARGVKTARIFMEGRGRRVEDFSQRRALLTFNTMLTQIGGQTIYWRDKSEAIKSGARDRKEISSFSLSSQFPHGPETIERAGNGRSGWRGRGEVEDKLIFYTQR